MHIDIESLALAAKERGINVEDMVAQAEKQLLYSYMRMPGALSSARAQIDLEENTVTIWAREINEDGSVSETEFDDTPSSFGQLASRILKDVIRKSLRAADDLQVLDSVQDRLMQMVFGKVQPGADGRSIILRLSDGIEARLPLQEQIPTEKLYVDQPLRALLVEANQSAKGPVLVVSRTHPNLVRKLFEINSPEVAQGFVEIVSVAREAGFRSKIAVRPLSAGVNAKAACIGEHGNRVQAVVQELAGEKIDIVDWHEDPAEFVAAALAPAKVSAVAVIDMNARQARAIVPREQLSLAIGKEGQNARLAARLTGWKIDIHPDDSQVQC